MSLRLIALSTCAILAIAVCLWWALRPSMTHPHNGNASNPGHDAASNGAFRPMARPPFRPESPRRSILVSGPSKWPAETRCRAFLVGLVSQARSPALQLVPAEGAWLLAERADWPADSGMLLIVEHLAASAETQAGSSFFECFLVNFKREPAPRFTLRPPAKSSELSVAALDAETRQPISAEVTLFGDRRLACTNLAESLLSATDMSVVQSKLSAIQVAMLSASPMIKIAKGPAPLVLHGCETGSSVMVHGTADGYSSASTSFEITTDTAFIALKATTSVLLTVVDPLDSPIQRPGTCSFGLSLLTPASTTSLKWQSKGAREFLFEDVPQGVVSVAASIGNRAATRELTVRPGFNKVTLELPPAASPPLFQVSFIDQHGKPVEGLRVSAQSAATGQGESLRLKAGATQSWSASLLPPVRVFVSDPWGRFAQSPPEEGLVLVHAENTVTLKLMETDIRRFGSVTLEVDPRLTREVMISYWPQCESLVDTQSVPLFHAGSQTLAVPSNGLIELTEVPYGILVARSIGKRGELAPAARIEISEQSLARENQSIHVRLQDADHAGVDRVIRLVDASTGQPLPSGLEFMLDDLAYSPALLRLREGGMLILSGLVPGRYTLSCVTEEYTAEGGSSHFELDATGPAQEIALRAVKGGLVRATLQFADNDVEWLQVEPMDRELGLKPVRFEVDSTGAAYITNIRSGTYQIGVVRRDGQPVMSSLKLHFPRGASRFSVQYRDAQWSVRQ